MLAREAELARLCHYRMGLLGPGYNQDRMLVSEYGYALGTDQGTALTARVLHLMGKDLTVDSEADLLLKRAHRNMDTLPTGHEDCSAIIDYASGHGNKPLRDVIRDLRTGNAYVVELGKGQLYCNWFNSTNALRKTDLKQVIAHGDALPHAG